MKITIISVLLLFSIGCEKPKSQETLEQSVIKLYYVSKTGDDDNPGTKEKPFKSIDRINKLNLEPGDAVYFNGGEIFDGTLSITINGTENEPVIISSYGTGRAEINGATGHAMVLAGNFFKIDNINAKGAGRKTGNITEGIQLTEVRDAVVEDVKIEGFQKAGLHLYNCKNVEIKKVEAAENGFSGIYIKGSEKGESKNIVIKDCKAENNPGDPTSLTNHSGNGILVSTSDSVLIDHCTATNNGWDMPRTGNGPVGIWAHESDKVTIQYCISYKNKTAKGAKDGGGFDFDGGMTNSMIQYCLSYENEGAGYGLFQYSGASSWHNNVVRYCVSINDGISTEDLGAFLVWNQDPDSNNFRNCIVYNNLVYNTSVSAVKFASNSLNSQFLFCNNIFIGSEKIIDGPTSGEKFIGNVWWPSGGKIKFRDHNTVIDWAEATGQEKLNGQIMGKQINPRLQGPFVTHLTDPYQLHSLLNYTLQSTSSLKNTGLNLFALFNVPLPPNDFYGNPVPMGINPEPGIFELKE
jgi:hypothetical protein